MKRGFMRQLPFVSEARLGEVRLAAPADPCEGLGLLAQYQCQINQIKERLTAPSTTPPPNAGMPVYVPPTNPLPVPPGRYSECPPGYTRSQSPPYPCLKDVEDVPSAYRPGRRPVSPGFTPQGPVVPVGITSGGNTRELPPPPPSTIAPPVVPGWSLTPCPPGFTRDPAPPYECRRNVASTDRVMPPGAQGYYPGGGDIRVPSGGSMFPGGSLWSGGGGGVSAPGLTGRAGFLGQVRMAGGGTPF